MSRDSNHTSRVTLRLQPRNLPLATLALAAILLLAHIGFDPQLSLLRGRSFDIYQNYFPKPDDRPSPLVLVTIDEAALAQQGRWPWNRGIVADLIDAIAGNGAAVIGLDLLFPEPDTTPGGPEGDAALAEALAAAPTVLAASVGDTATAIDIHPKVSYSVVGDARSERPGMPGVTASLKAMNEAASGMGIIRSFADSDGVLRRLPLLWLSKTDGNSIVWPAFATELVRVYAGDPGPAARMNGGGFAALRLAGTIIDLDPDGAIWLVEKRNPNLRVSAAALLNGADEPLLRDAIAIVSFNAIGLDTFHNTPAHAQRLGSEVHALLAEQLLFGKYLVTPADARWIERAFFAVAAVLLLVLIALASNRLILALPGVLLIIASPLIAGALAYLFRNELYEAIQPAAGLFLVAAAEGFSRFRRAEQRRQTLKRQFERFLSPDVVKALASGDADAILQVDKREITVMMIDLRGFTTMTNALDPGQTVDLVNHFLSLATSEIFARRGTVDKFIGDAVLAFWNAPLDEPKHADLAI
ncbi:MAG: adenylate/guanylate cyclase domain-containing protein, partial [Cucumibacter sp.]